MFDSNNPAHLRERLAALEAPEGTAIEVLCRETWQPVIHPLWCANTRYRIAGQAEPVQADSTDMLAELKRAWDSGWRPFDIKLSETSQVVRPSPPPDFDILGDGDDIRYGDYFYDRDSVNAQWKEVPIGYEGRVYQTNTRRFFARKKPSA